MGGNSATDVPGSFETGSRLEAHQHVSTTSVWPPLGSNEPAAHPDMQNINNTDANLSDQLVKGINIVSVACGWPTTGYLR